MEDEILKQADDVALITLDDLKPLVADLEDEKYSAGLNKIQQEYLTLVKGVLSNPDVLNNAQGEEVVAELIRGANRIGGVDDIAAKASRDIMRLKGQRFDQDSMSQVLSEYDIKLPSVEDIKFDDYDDLDEEHDKVDGWGIQAKAAINLRIKENPELLAYRDEMFANIDNNTKYLKRKVGATDSGFVDFLGRVSEGAATFIDGLGLDGTADFLRTHLSKSNPDWDDHMSSVVGGAIGQIGGLIGAGVGAAAALGTGVGGLAALGIGAVSNLTATKDEARQKVKDATGSENLAEDAAEDWKTYGAAGLEIASNVFLAGTGKIGAKLLSKAGAKSAIAKELSKNVDVAGKSLNKLSEYAGKGGDLVVKAGVEGTTEAIQGAIGDYTAGQVSNMRDKFEPLDMRNRAMDFIGGVAGGAFASVATNYIIPQRLQAQTTGETDAPIPEANAEAELETGGISADTSLNQFSSLLDVKTAAQEDIEKATNIAKNVYGSLKMTLGSAINNPEVQKVTDAVLNMYDQARQSAVNYTKRTKPKKAVTPDISTPETVTTEAVTADISTPETVTPEAVTAEAINTEDTILNTDVSSQVADLSTDIETINTPQEVVDTPLKKLETTLKSFKTIDTVTEDGVKKSTFNLGAAEVGDATVSGAYSDTELVTESVFKDPKAGLRAGSPGLQSKSFQLQVDENTNQVTLLERASNKPDAVFKPVEGINTAEDADVYLNKQLTTQGEITRRGEIRNRLGTTETRATKKITKPNVDVWQAPEGLKSFVRSAIPGMRSETSGGDQAVYKKQAIDYLNSTQAVNDLKSVGIEGDQAIDVIEDFKVTIPEKGSAGILRGLANDVVNKAGFKVDATSGGLISTSATNTSTSPEVFTETVEESTPVKKSVVKTVTAEDIQEERTGYKENIKSTYGEEGYSDLVQRAKESFISRRIPAKALETPEGLNKVEEAIIKTLSASDWTPSDGVQEAERILSSLLNPSEYNRTGFKISEQGVAKNRTLNRTRRIIRELSNTDIKVGSTKDFDESNTTTFGPSANRPAKAVGKLTKKMMSTGGAAKAFYEIMLDRVLLSGQQAPFTAMHELAERALINNPVFTESLLKIADPTVFQDVDDIQNAAVAVSNLIRVSPLLDANGKPDYKEAMIDALASYFYDGFDSIINVAPPIVGELKRVIEDYIADTTKQPTVIQNIVAAINKIDAMSDEDIARDDIQADAKLRKEAGDALVKKNKDTHTVKQALMAIRRFVKTGLLNVYDEIERAASTLGPNHPINKVFQASLLQYKNRHQLAQARASYIVSGAANLVNMGIPEETISEYLVNNRILNELAMWEQTIKTNPRAMTDLKEVITTTPELTELLNTPTLGNTTTVRDFINNANTANDVMNAFNELRSLLYATDPNTYAEITKSVRKNVNSKQLPKSIADQYKIMLADIFNTDKAGRGNLSNPNLDNRTTAQAKLDVIKKDIGADNYKAIEDFQENVLAKTIIENIQESEDVGKIGRETAQFFINNANAYATFQLANEIIDDPTVDASIRAQIGMDADATLAPALGLTTLKMLSIAEQNQTQRFSNNLVSMLYAVGATDMNIKPILATDNSRKGNTWIKNAGFNQVNNTKKTLSPSDVPAYTVEDIFTKLKDLKSQNPDKSYVVSANEGDYVVHEVNSPIVNDALRPGVPSESSNAAFKILNDTMMIARLSLVTHNPLFIFPATARMYSRLYTLDRGGKALNEKISPVDAVKAFLKAPLFGIYFDKNTRNLVKQSRRAVKQYFKDNINTKDMLNLATQKIDSTTTWDQLLTPGALSALEYRGIFSATPPTGVSPDVTSAFTTRYNILASPQERALNRLIQREGKSEKLLEKLDNYQGVGSTQAKAVVKAFQNYLNFTRDLNTSLEMVEKLSGIGLFMSQGMTLDQAVLKANREVGNPDPTGGGKYKRQMSPLLLYPTSIMNSLNVLWDTTKETFKNPLTDQRALRVGLMAFRNKLLTTPVIAGAMAYTLSKGLGADDDEAEDNATIAKRLVQNIPVFDRQNGNAIPLMFRDPRSGNLIAPWDVPSAKDLDPSWTTVYLRLPYDHIAMTVSGAVSDLVEGITEGTGIDTVVGSMISSSIGQALPSAGPLVNSALGGYSLVKGQNPVDSFTGRPIVDEDTFEAGGVGVGAEYAKYMLSQFAPFIPYRGTKDDSKTKLLEPTNSMVDMLPRMLKFGIIKDSNYGNVSSTISRTNEIQSVIGQIKQDLPDEVNNRILRLNELQREATFRLSLEKERLRTQGVDPDTMNLRGLNFLSPDQQEEHEKLRIWRKSYYDTAVDAAKIAYLQGNDEDYQEFLQGASEGFED
jgi:hypothetical protein